MSEINKQNKKPIKIYVINTMTKLEKDQNGFPDFGSERIVGFYKEFKDAEDAVVNNICDIYETIYNYALIEEVEEGLYNSSLNRWFYKYNKEKDEYEKIEEPEFLKHYSGFTIG